jgi:hypothetical protein
MAEPPLDNPIEPNPAAPQSADESAQAPPNTPPPETHVPAGVEDQARPEETNHEIREWWKLAVETLTLLAVLWYACVAADQLTEMRSATTATQGAAKAAKDSVDLARKNAHFDQRAWVSVLFGEFTPKIGEPLAFKLHFTDTGKSPARNVQGEAVTVFLKLKDTLTFSYGHKTAIDLGTMFQNTPQDAVSYLLPPNVPKEVKIKRVIVSASMADDLINSRAYIVVYGRLAYDTVFNGHHWIQFCAPSGAMEFNQRECVDYNQVDTDEEP